MPTVIEISYLVFMCGQGEGVAYRGRALVELVTTLGEIPEIPVADIENSELLRVQVSSLY